MKVLMIIPPKVNGEWVVREEKHVSSGSKQIVPRTAQLLSALLEQEIPQGLDLRLIEAQRDDLDIGQVKERVREERADLIITFLSCFHIPWDRECAELEYPTIAIILQQNIDQREALELYGLKTRYICKNETEFPVVEAVREFLQTGKIEKTPGFLLNEEYGIIDTGDAAPGDMDFFPTPYHPNFQVEKYFAIREENPIILEKRAFNLNTMRGCPFNCLFCGQANRGKKSPRFQNVEGVLRDIRFYHEKFGVEHFAFVDNELAANMPRAKSICRAIIREKIKIRFVINNRVELFDDELIALLKEAGCINVRLGIETCDPLIQEFINKKLNLAKVKILVKKLKDAGLQVHFYMTPGIPGETKETLHMNAKFIAETDPYTYSSGPLFIMPNSNFYHYCKDNGLLIEKDWSQYRDYSKLCYINESYENMEQILEAEAYMRKMVDLYKIG